MIKTVNKTKFNWKLSLSKQKEQTPPKEQSRQKKFEAYLSDHMSDDEQTAKDFLVEASNKFQQRLRKTRKISQKPFKRAKILEWNDNFYTNLLDWNFENIIFCGGLDKLYKSTLKSGQNEEMENILCIKKSLVNAIKCSPTQKTVAMAYETGNLTVYDYSKRKIVHNVALHAFRITALDWTSKCILTGSRDRETSIIDERTMRKVIFLKKIHTQQILAIKKYDHLVATGGNDNLVAIYDVRKQNQAVYYYKHGSAVKSLAWIQSSKNLISGGGTNDRRINIWNFANNQIAKEIDTGSQVCNLVYSKNTAQIVSCQGFSQNQIILWDMQGNRVNTLHGQHNSRILYCAMDPTGEYVATGAGDKSFFVWKMFPKATRKNRLLEQFDLR